MLIVAKPIRSKEAHNGKYCRWWGIEKPPPGNRSSLLIQRLRIYSDVQKSSVKPEPKMKSDLLPIAPTSSPTIGNTLVMRHLAFALI